jgi:hypothetical protein
VRKWKKIYFFTRNVYPRVTLLSAMASNPDWVLTHNTKHFTKTVARRTSLRIGTPAEFFRELATLFR